MCSKYVCRAGRLRSKQIAPNRRPEGQERLVPESISIAHKGDIEETVVYALMVKA